MVKGVGAKTSEELQQAFYHPAHLGPEFGWMTKHSRLRDEYQEKSIN